LTPGLLYFQVYYSIWSKFKEGALIGMLFCNVNPEEM